MRLGDLAGRLGLAWRGRADFEVSEFCDPHRVSPSALLFVEKPVEKLPAGAGAYLVPETWASGVGAGAPENLLISKDPRASFRALLALLDPRVVPEPGARLSPVPPGADVARDAHIGPGVTLGTGCRVGSRTVLMGHNWIGPGVVVGEGCVLHPGVVLEQGTVVGSRVILHANSVLGSDGFGFHSSAKGHEKIPQIGGVEIGDDVEIGSHVSIARATVGATRIGRGSKIDNLVQIAHNVQIGEGALIASQSGVAGSSKLGRGVVLAGQVGVADHVEIGDGVIMAAGSGAATGRKVPAGSVLAGRYGLPLMEEKRIQVLLRRLPELFKRLGRGPGES